LIFGHGLSKNTDEGLAAPFYLGVEFWVTGCRFRLSDAK